MDTTNLTPEPTEADRIIDAMGGTAAVAARFNIKPPSVSEWRRLGIPPARLQTIQLLRPDLFESPSPDDETASVSKAA